MPILDGMLNKGREGKALRERAEIIYNEIRHLFIGESLLDIGCGNGLISNFAKQHFTRIVLMDVQDYLDPGIDRQSMKFLNYKEGDALPAKGKFDTVLLLVVLHHASDPVELLKLAWEATARRLIIIESVIGVKQEMPPAKYELLNRSVEDQIAFAAFVDWFYNRVLHADVPVPYNFTTVEKWHSTFLANNMHVSGIKHFGQDIEIGPEYHVLFVLDKQPTVKDAPINVPGHDDPGHDDRQFDVFLSHNSTNKTAVRDLGESLKRRGLRVWLDEWELVPGRSWQEAIEEIVRTTRSAVVLVGADGLGPWEISEMRACLYQFVNRGLPVIPVLLPEAPKQPDLPLFLTQFTWVDLRGGINEDGLARLHWGITGERP